jgi:hypothetical protein
MKISNITEVKKLTKTGAAGITIGTMIYCTVDVETGYLWWKKVSKRQVCKQEINWFFVDTGDFTPDYQMENLWRAYVAKNKMFD